jgi:hypothetical protein
MSILLVMIALATSGVAVVVAGEVVLTVVLSLWMIFLVGGWVVLTLLGRLLDGLERLFWRRA